MVKMIKILMASAIILLGLIHNCIAEDSVKPNGKPKRPNIPFKDIGWKRHGNNVGFSPVIVWYPNGVIFNAGPVAISDDRRYVRIGINIGFGQVISVDTFNFSNGEYKHIK